MTGECLLEHWCLNLRSSTRRSETWRQISSRILAAFTGDPLAVWATPQFTLRRTTPAQMPATMPSLVLSSCRLQPTNCMVNSTEFVFSISRRHCAALVDMRYLIPCRVDLHG